MSNRLSTGAELTKAGTDLTKCHLTRGRIDQWSISQKVVSLRSVVSVNFNQSKARKSHLR